MSSNDPQQPIQPAPQKEPNKAYSIGDSISSSQTPIEPPLPSSEPLPKIDPIIPPQPDPIEPPKDTYKQSYKKFEYKLKDSFENLRSSRPYTYAISNQEMTATYILLVIGIILLFVNPLAGSIILGAVAGYHFAPEIIAFLRHFTQILEAPNQVRYIVLLTTLIGLFIQAPGIFFGAVFVAALKQILAAPIVDPTIDAKDQTDFTNDDKKL
jgi:hypothetical protein